MAIFNRRDFIFTLIAFLSGFTIKPSRAFPLESKNKSAGSSFSPGRGETAWAEKADLIAIRAKDAFSGDDSIHPYVNRINQESVQTMIDAGLERLTGQKGSRAAWRSLFNYRKGEQVLIKPNLNWIDCAFQKIITSPQVVNSLIRGLILHHGIKEKDITLYDVSRPIPSFYRKRILYDIHYVGQPVSYYQRGRRKFFGDWTRPSPKPIETTFPVKGNKGEPLKCYLPRIVASGDHLINMPIVKAHPFLLFSGAMKNHFGSIAFSDKTTSPSPFHGLHIDQFIVDVNTNEHLKKITRLVLCDALVGTWSDDHLGEPERFKTFGSAFPSSLFVSWDPLAMDFYLREIISKERAARDLPFKSDAFLSIAKERISGKDKLLFKSRSFEL